MPVFKFSTLGRKSAHNNHHSGGSSWPKLEPSTSVTHAHARSINSTVGARCFRQHRVMVFTAVGGTVVVVVDDDDTAAAFPTRTLAGIPYKLCSYILTKFSNAAYHKMRGLPLCVCVCVCVCG